jgi:hypothetical protein
MNSIKEDRIESLLTLKKQMQENIKAFEQNIIEMKKKVSSIEEEIKILRDERIS